jgi:hypothetical protein
VEERRQERRDGIRRWKVDHEAADTIEVAGSDAPPAGADGLDLAALRPPGDHDGEMRRKGTLFGRRKDRDREQVRAAEVM